MSASAWELLPLACAALASVVAAQVVIAQHIRRTYAWPPPPPRWWRPTPPQWPLFSFVVPPGRYHSGPWEETMPSGVGTYLVEIRHLRHIGPEGINPLGALPGDALCGRALRGGHHAFPEVEFVFDWPRAGQVMLRPCPSCQTVRARLEATYVADQVVPAPWWTEADHLQRMAAGKRPRPPRAAGQR